MITLEEIREIHKITIEMDRNNPDDYAPGERYIGIIEHMLEHVMSEEYSVYFNAAVALYTIASRHPFNNGNKRTASAAAGMILMDDGIEFTINEEVKTNFIKDIATPQKNISIEMIKEWLKNSTEKHNNI